MALLDDILTRLTSAGVVDGSTTWQGAINYMPSDPDQVVALYETPAPEPEQEWSIDYPTFQVVIRGDEYGSEDARTKAQNVFNALHAQEANIGGSYVYVYCSTPPFYVGPDQSNRPKFQLFFRTMKTR